jgi:two-component system chemotaxis sensor kinase CheA
MDDLVAEFVCEAAAGLASLQAGLARLSSRRPTPDVADEMLRRLHALKGVCGLIGFTRAETLAHAGEPVLVAARQTVPSPAALATLSEMFERIGSIVTEASAAHSEPDGDDDALVASLEAAAIDVSARRSEEAAPPSRPEPSPPPRPSDRRARPPWHGLDALARTLGDRLGKRIDLAVHGEALRIAPAACGPLRTALIALVRNACDHGVESPAERRAAGKPVRALIELSLQHAGEGAAIELCDDGRGVDPERIRAACVAAGALDRREAAVLGPEDSQALIFRPGVTTASAVTSVSGRGLGLELVRRELEGLGGAVRLASTPGAGARFLITLPATTLATAAARRAAAA